MRNQLGLAVALTLSGAALSACGDDGKGNSATAPTATTPATTAIDTASGLGPGEVRAGDPILIKTQLDGFNGKVASGSFVGDSAFCAGGTTHDEHGSISTGGLVHRTFNCPGGRLNVGFSPTQDSLIQSSTWKVLSATGSFKGLRGGGWMVVRAAKDAPTKGQETFTGTITR